VGGVIAIVLVAYTLRTQGVPQAALLLLGVGLGFALFHARFGFTSAWRQLVAVGQGKALRAHTVLLAATAILFAPFLAAGVSPTGVEVAGFVAPVGVGVVVGATICLTNFGIMVGALIASALAGAFTLHRRIPGRLALGAVIGGLLMGYGARLAYGCNIGAYLGGIASMSLHGWVWGIMALLGTWIGLRARPFFGLTRPRPTDGVC